MSIKKAAVKLSVAVVVTSLLTMLVVMDVLSVVRELKTLQTQMTIVDSGGQVGKSVFIMMIYSTLDQDNKLDPSSSCQCRLVKRETKNHSAPCFVIASQFDLSKSPQYSKTLGNRSTVLPLMVYEVPGDLKEHNLMQLDCFSEEELSVPFTVFFIPIGILEMIKVEQSQAIGESVFMDRPVYLVRSGHFTRLLLTKEVYLKVEEPAGMLNTFVKASTSQTYSGNAHFTQIEVAYASDNYLVSQETKVGSYWRVMTSTAAFILAAERAIAVTNNLLK